MQYNRKMINGVVFLEEQADYLLLLGKEGLYTVQAENDHWNVHYTLPGDTSNLDKRFISKDEALQDVYEMDIWRRNRWKFLPMKELRTRLKKLLMEAGFTQAELAEMVENCKDNIRRLERNKFINPTYQLHHDFTEFFEKPVEEILGYEEI
jgi:DNA-binding XRE family transcriptional regulator